MGQLKHDRALGMMLGLAVGDSFGVTADYTMPDPTFSRTELVGGGRCGLWPGQPTGVTGDAIGVLRAIRSPKDFDLDGAFRGIYDNLSPKSSPESSRRKKIAGAYPAAPPETNYSLVRIAGLALLDLPWRGPLFQIIDDCSRLKAHTETCANANRILLAGLRTGLRGGNKQKVMRSMAMTAHFLKWRYSLDATLTREWSRLSTTKWVVNTIHAAFWSLSHCQSFEEAIIKLSARGQDAGGTCAVAGALFGSIGGVEAIPERWLRVLEKRREIESEVLRILSDGKSERILF